MPKKFRDADKELKKAGFQQARQNGSHITYKNAAGRTVVVPKHDEIKTGTWSSILRQAGLKKSKPMTERPLDAQAAQRLAGAGVAPPGSPVPAASQPGQGQGAAPAQNQQKPAPRSFGGLGGR
jgi:predicted RNA binding protein YcfA (HicA-like mRNA interferase family)